MDIYHDKMNRLEAILHKKTEELKVIHKKRERRKLRKAK